MKRLLFVVLMTVCSVSWAEWEILSRSRDGERTFYCDKSTIRKNGEISRMWDLKDLSSMNTNAGGDRYMSVKSLQAYNCRAETRAIISLVQYSGSMGQGSVVRSITVQERELEWRPIVPASIAESQWKIACGSK